MKPASNHQSLSIYGLFQLSRIYEETGRLDLAEETIIKLLRQNDLYGPAYRVLGNIYHKRGDATLGDEYNIRANDLLPFSPPVDTLIDKLALISRSELYLLKKIDEKVNASDFDFALKLVKQGMKYLPDNKHFLSKAIGVFLAKNMNQEAIELTEKHKSYFKDDYPELSVVGNHFYQKAYAPKP
jgi:tetratricopeptide (TPR) repeat protein